MTRQKNPQRWKSVRKHKKALKLFARRYFGLRGKELKCEVEKKLHKDLEEWLLQSEKKLGVWESIQIFHRFRNFRQREDCREDEWQYVWEKNWHKVIPKDLGVEDMLASATVLFRGAVA